MFCKTFKDTVLQDWSGWNWYQSKGLYYRERSSSANFARPSFCESLLKLQNYLLQSLAIRHLRVNNTHSSSCGFCFTLNKDWKRHNEEQWNLLPMWCSELVLITFLLSIGTGTLNFPGLCYLRREHLADARIFWSAVGNCCHKLPFTEQGGASRNFKGVSHDEGRVDFVKNSLRLSI